MLKHKIKKEEGSGLVLTLMVLLVLSVLGASVATVTMGSNRLGHATQDSNSAYYIAEAGANMAYEEIRQGVVNAYYNNNELGVQTTIDSLPDEYNNFDMQSGHQPEAHVSVSEPEIEGDKKTYTITSTGKIGPSSRTVTKSFYVKWVEKKPKGDSSLPIVSSNTSLVIKDKISLVNGYVKGDMYLDSNQKGSFRLSNSGAVGYEKVITSYPGNLNDIYIGESNYRDNISETIYNKSNYDWEFLNKYKPDIPESIDGFIKHNGLFESNQTINLNKNYSTNKMIMRGNHIINVPSDVYLSVNTMDKGWGTTKFQGDGKLVVILHDNANIGGELKSDTRGKLNIIYLNSEKELEISDGGRNIYANIIALNSNVIVTRSAEVHGDIIAKNITISGQGKVYGNVFTNHAEISGSGHLFGSLIAKTVHIDNSGGTIRPANYSNESSNEESEEITEVRADDLISSGPAIEK